MSIRLPKGYRETVHIQSGAYPVEHTRVLHRHEPRVPRRRENPRLRE